MPEANYILVPSNPVGSYLDPAASATSKPKLLDSFYENLHSCHSFPTHLSKCGYGTVHELLNDSDDLCHTMPLPVPRLRFAAPWTDFEEGLILIRLRCHDKKPRGCK